jgi:uncharacterized protein (DUF58 family)
MLRGWRERAQGWLFRWRGPESGTIVLSQRRIFILPTGQGLLLALVVLLTLVGSTNYDLALGFVLAFLLAAAAIQVMVHTFRNLLRLRISAGRCEPVFAGSRARFTLRVDNPAPIARHAVAVSAGPEGADYLDLPAAGSAEAVVEVPALRRGWLQPGRLTVFTRFPAGLFRAWSYAEPDMRCLVYPAPAWPGIPLPVNAASSGEGGLKDPGPEEFTGLRRYRPGDRPAHLAWKAMARDDSLHAKAFAGQAPTELWLDWAVLPPGLDTEARLGHLARWVIEADRLGLRYGLRLPGQILRSGDGPAQRMACLRALALHGTETAQP